MSDVKMSKKIEAKLGSRHISKTDIEECFVNRPYKRFLEDERYGNKTVPPTWWFVSETDSSRVLKVVFMFRDSYKVIKSAYEPNAEEVRIYEKYAP